MLQLASPELVITHENEHDERPMRPSIVVLRKNVSIGTPIILLTLYGHKHCREPDIRDTLIEK